MTDSIKEVPKYAQCDEHRMQTRTPRTVVLSVR